MTTRSTNPYDTVAASFIKADETVFPFNKRVEEARNLRLAQEYQRRGLPFRTSLPVGTALDKINDELQRQLATRGPEEPIKEMQALARKELPGIIRKGIMQPIIPKEAVEQTPRWIQPVASAVREMSSPSTIAATLATAGLGPAVAGAIRGSGAIAPNVGQQIARSVIPQLPRIIPKIVSGARNVTAGALEPIVRGPFAARVLAETGLGVGAGAAAETAVGALPENVPTPVRIATGLGAGLVGGAGTIAGTRAAVGAARATPGAARAVGRGIQAETVGTGLSRGLPGAIRLSPELTPSRITKFLDEGLQKRYAAAKDLVEKKLGFDFDALAGTREDEFFLALERKAPPIRKSSVSPEQFAVAPVGLRERLVQYSHQAMPTHYFKSFEDLDNFLVTGQYVPPVITSPIRQGPIKALYQTAKGRAPSAAAKTADRITVTGGKGYISGKVDLEGGERATLERLQQQPRQPLYTEGTWRDIAEEMPVSQAAKPAPIARAVEPSIPPQQVQPVGVPPPGGAPAGRVAEAVSPVEAAAQAKPGIARVRLSIRETKQGQGGFLVYGRDTRNRQVRVLAKTLDEAKQARENIRAGKEAFVGTEAEAADRALLRAERKLKAAMKTGEAGRIQRVTEELEAAQTRKTQVESAPPPSEPPKPPSTISPDGVAVPMPEFNEASAKLTRIIRNSAKMTSREIADLRTKEMSRRAAIAAEATEKALKEGRSPLAGIRSAQKGELPTKALQLADRITPNEFAVLRDRIYKTLGSELNFTSANLEESLHRLAFEGVVPTESEMLWFEEIFGPELVEAFRSLRGKGAKVKETLLELWNLPRAVLASFDDSMVLRQGLHLLPEGAPALKAFKAHIRAIKKAGADAVNEEIRANEWFNHGRAHGLDLTLPNLARGIGGREEAFFGASELVKRIPVLGKGIEISERIATSYLNKLRMESYAAHAAELKRMNAGYDAFKELAENINILSGRATLGRAQALAPYLNGVFFSARLNWARMQTPFRILRQVPNLDTPEGRHMAKMLARDVYGMYAGILGMVGLASASGLAVVEWDPKSSDFLKMQVGSTRIDPWAGQQQFAVLMARLAMGQRQTTTTRQDIPSDPVDTIARFIESKVHPALGMLLTVRRGKNFVGEKLTVKSFAKQWLPLFIQDIQEIADGTTPGMAGALGVPAFFGVSVYNIPSVPSSVIRQFQEAIDEYNAIPTDTLAIPRGGMTRTEWRKQNAQGEAGLFLAGQVTTLSSTRAVTAVESIIKEHGINPDWISGVVERKERRAIAAQSGRTLSSNYVDELLRRLDISIQSTTPGQGTSRTPELGTPPPTERPTLKPIEDLFKNRSNYGPMAAPETASLRPSEEIAPPAVQKWEEVSADLSASLLRALERVWYDGGKLTEAEEVKLRDVWQKHSFGQKNFSAWLKQTLRQVQEQAAWHAPVGNTR